MDELKVTASSAAEIELGVAEWNASLRPGGKLMLSVSNQALFAEAKLPLLLHDFLIRLEESTSNVLCATKPEWEAGTKVPLKSNAASEKIIPIRTDDDDLIDEDDLLAADGLQPPTVPDDVGCSARKPCAGCTCGRADALAASKASAPRSSSCGNCHKGDAFRCESCPYLGKPAFKAGEGHLILEVVDDL